MFAGVRRLTLRRGDVAQPRLDRRAAQVGMQGGGDFRFALVTQPLDRL
jgi:hypothetical protein